MFLTWISETLEKWVISKCKAWAFWNGLAFWYKQFRDDFCKAANLAKIKHAGVINCIYEPHTKGQKIHHPKNFNYKL